MEKRKLSRGCAMLAFCTKYYKEILAEAECYMCNQTSSISCPYRLNKEPEEQDVENPHRLKIWKIYNKWVNYIRSNKLENEKELDEAHEIICLLSAVAQDLIHKIEKQKSSVLQRKIEEVISAIEDKIND